MFLYFYFSDYDPRFSTDLSHDRSRSRTTPTRKPLKITPCRKKQRGIEIIETKRDTKILRRKREKKIGGMKGKEGGNNGQNRSDKAAHRQERKKMAPTRYTRFARHVTDESIQDKAQLGYSTPLRHSGLIDRPVGRCTRRGNTRRRNLLDYKNARLIESW